VGKWKVVQGTSEDVACWSLGGNDSPATLNLLGRG
jgi:hypothetical protein